MLDIISMITLSIFILTGAFMLLIIIGGNMNKSKEEQKFENEEQMKYLKEYNLKKTKKL